MRQADTLPRRLFLNRGRSSMKQVIALLVEVSVSLAAVRKAFPYVALVILAAALLYATSFGTLPRADFTFNNATEIKTVDPAKATGEPEGRVIEGLYEGLLRRLPKPDSPEPSRLKNTPYEAQLAAADSMIVSEDGRTYTFHIRDSAKWSDGSPLTAHDFAWSWLRMLHPETASEYAYQLWYVKGAEQFNKGEFAVGDAVEVELADRPRRSQTFPRGTVVRGILKGERKPNSGDEKTIHAGTVYEVEVEGKLHEYCRQKGKAPLEEIVQILPDFEATVGIHATSDRELVVTLNHRTPYFPDLVAFYPLYPTNRACIEKYGDPDFTRAENLVSNGPFKIKFRRIRDRVRLVKNEHYWNAENVKLNVIDALAISSDIAALNMYETGQIDWSPSVPSTIIPELRDREDFHTAPILSVYFYRVNCKRPPLDNKLVRRALNLAIDKRLICENIMRAGEIPATHLVPPGIEGYASPDGLLFNVREAQRLLAEAGYSQGHNFPKIEILYNTHETHQAIAEVIQNDWKRNLGINVELRGLEWGTYLESQQKFQYMVSRAGWNADYDDPNTFLDMFLTGGANNQTGWSNKKYDALVLGAAKETDAEKRLAMLAEAETLFVEELPILPIAFYMSKELVKPNVRGLSLNSLKVHPLHLIEIEEQP